MIRTIVIALFCLNAVHTVSAQSSNTKVRYDGLYYANTCETIVNGKSLDMYTYIKFIENGNVYTQTLNQLDPKYVAVKFRKDGTYERKGTFQVSNSELSINLEKKESKYKIELPGVNTTYNEDDINVFDCQKVVSYSGTMKSNNELDLNIMYSDGIQKKFTFTFAPIMDTTRIVIPWLTKKIAVPGVWKKSKEAGSQIFLTNDDLTTVAVSLFKKNTLEFFTDTQTEPQTLAAYYKWETDYQHDELGLVVQKLEENTKDNYIIWSTEKKDETGRNLLLGACSGQVIYNLLVFSDTMNEDEKIKMLKNLYLLNNKLE